MFPVAAVEYVPVEELHVTVGVLWGEAHGKLLVAQTVTTGAASFAAWPEFPLNVHEWPLGQLAFEIVSPVGATVSVVTLRLPFAPEKVVPSIVALAVIVCVPSVSALVVTL